MKKLLFAFTLMLATTAFVFAQDTTSTQRSRDRQKTDRSSDQQSSAEWNMTDKDVIAASELPQNIRQQLEGSDYSGWTVQNAYRKQKNNQTFYAVELSNGSQTKKVKFDAQGNVVKEKNKRDKNQ